MVKKLLLLVIPICLGLQTRAQELPYGKKQYFLAIENGDTIPGIILPAVTVQSSLDAYLYKLYRYRKYVQRTLELAQFVTEIHRDFSDSLNHISRKKIQKKFLKNEKKKLFEQFNGVITAMNTAEGRVFVKLIYRQSGVATFDIIKQFQGSVKATMWQALSRTGGANLKLTYDPAYEDKIIEDVMKEIESGQLKAHPMPKSKAEFKALRKL